MPTRVLELLVKRLGLAGPGLASALLLCLASPPANLSFLSFVALVPWLLQIRKLDSKQARRSGFWFGLFFFSYQMFWLIPFVGRWTGTMALGLIPWVIVLIFHLPYFVLLGWMVQRAYALKRTWLVPIAWASIEVIRTFIPLFAIPTSYIALPLWIMPEIIQSAAFGTILFSGAIVAWLNSFVADLFDGIPPRTAIIQVTALLLIFMLNVLRWSAPNIGPKSVFSVAQLGVDLAFGDQATEPIRVRKAMKEISDRAQIQNPSLLILPEGMSRSTEMEPWRPDFPTPVGIPYVYGLQRGFNPVYQSSGAFDGIRTKFCDKAKLVPFGEYVPFRSLFGFAGNFKLPTGDLKPSTEFTNFKFRNYTASTILCFEAMFPDVAIKKIDKGGQFIAVQSIDDWYLDSPLGEQLLALSAFRAIENGVPLFRSSSLGNTAAFDSRGNLKMHIPLYKLDVARVEMPIPARGDAFSGRLMFPPLCIIIAIFGLGINTKRPTPSTKKSSKK